MPSATDILSARRGFRARTCAVARNPHDAALHLARLHASLQLDDSEPVQGTLADMFMALPGSETAMRQAALQLAGTRLHPYVAEAFGRHAHGHALTAITPLATRWSVFAQPSANVPARVRRTSPDHSRRLAAQVVEALLEGDPMQAPKIESDFLDHCISCQDKLAFMIASRDLRRHEVAVGDRWGQVAAWLERRGALGDAQGETADTAMR
ncbi:hypothetical protein OK348_08815 [Flavobacterium sp. MXW15]|uniref:Zf-HC2 domain-containing protein n=1 Tax=Xanthomonas chitinilytica TaxID=2989819 RepID=A0ABT3JW73_9XANT|nr:hypothetical protein [Xanthomonas sp. H13-6]MCW4454898.1 hypothetical protein [Flavobacterium sp. MXW15]MCW4472474.1 hypothetical protein [Xanthomonas sp. H13-6]